MVLGLVDRLSEAGILAFGPTAAAARLEGSKKFTKSFCRRHRIPTAFSAQFDVHEKAAALDYVRTHPLPCVIKADGLAGGKGVTIAQSTAEAEAAIEAMLEGAFGAASKSILVEEFLDGFEVSLFAISDGHNVVEFGTAQDHKRAYDGDKGPNTGGMGAFSPAIQLDSSTKARALAEIIEPTVRSMRQDGTPFIGVLYAGLMITADGPKLIEFNVRFGDPECQVVLPRLKNDLAKLLRQCAEQKLGDESVAWHAEIAINVVMASGGYPGAYESGTVISGLGRLGEQPDTICYHAGTARRDGLLVANGGRVLSITSMGPDLATARRRVYEAIETIDWPEGHYRSDIGLSALTSLS
ncbi:MAG: phosphoribosylamine--glycine ligase [Pseudomonadota bacterium]